jgi:hypothetical protein
MRLLFLCLGLFLHSTIAKTQQLPGKQVYIVNAQKNAVTFGVSCDNRQTWKSQTLKGHERQRFECDKSDAKMWIHINTDLRGKPHQETEKGLENRERYELFWNKSNGEKKWDVRKL